MLDTRLTGLREGHALKELKAILRQYEEELRRVSRMSMLNRLMNEF